MTTGIVLFAHGSRDPLWRRPIEAVATAIAARAPKAAVACAYLELVEPDLPTAVNRLLAQGARHVRVLPLFFGMGKHAREDLPELVAGYQRIPSGLRKEAHAGRTPDETLVGGLKMLESEIGNAARSLAAGELDNLEPAAMPGEARPYLARARDGVMAFSWDQQAFEQRVSVELT